jgi:hypothetical protein
MHNFNIIVFIGGLLTICGLALTGTVISNEFSQAEDKINGDWVNLTNSYKTRYEAVGKLAELPQIKSDFPEFVSGYTAINDSPVVKIDSDFGKVTPEALAAYDAMNHRVDLLVKTLSLQVDTHKEWAEDKKIKEQTDALARAETDIATQRGSLILRITSFNNDIKNSWIAKRHHYEAKTVVQLGG